ncbi:MAG TPA: hypothetical protein VLF40_02805 [Candidatus Saccharimonadales bacterium]|nr:hypothetical protein [Candidatus Saccharimonadales bacterium]
MAHNHNHSPHPEGPSPLALAEQLADPYAESQRVVEQENRRVAGAMVERHLPERRSRQLARKVLGVVGVQLADKRTVLKLSEFERKSQELNTEDVQRSLETSREHIRQNTNWGADDVEVDAYLGMDKELNDSDAILPSSFRGWHKAAQDEKGEKFTFLQWMANHATDEQLTNVWQWHDSYLSKLDSDPAFIEQVARTKADFQRGLKEGLRTHELHPNMAKYVQNLDRITVRHGSPFSALTATAQAYPSRDDHLLYIKPNRSDFAFHHEYMHVLYPGFEDAMTDEAATERLAMVTYNNSHAPADRLATDDSPYAENIQIQETLERMARGRSGLYGLSQGYAGSGHARQNQAQYVKQMDGAIGMPIAQALLEVRQDVRGALRAQGDVWSASNSSTTYTLEVVQLLEKLASERGGNQGLDYMLDRLAIIQFEKRDRRPLAVDNATVALAGRAVHKALEIQERDSGQLTLAA